MDKKKSCYSLNEQKRASHKHRDFLRGENGSEEKPIIAGKKDDAGNILGVSLLEAKKIITGERQDQYGNPEDSFATIAEFWTTYLKSRKVDNGAPVTALDAANMMILFKMARCLGQSPKRDNYIDIQGYAAICADRLMQSKEE